MSAIHWLNDIENSKQAFGEEAVKTKPVDKDVAHYFQEREVNTNEDEVGVEE